ncbi:hypothetical protein CHS0354_013231 [Potamilus streckersoni]|uniref:Uncharacterized protein n=1 Tax=Potamilus streckersoni TaxID=2493646 RepID=A0AAE0SR61_9BIVA|nr:hypothetical protein CHS0354_013231 [Potamilus streckersoni]
MNRNVKLTNVSLNVIGDNDDWYVDCSDDEKYNPTHQPLGTWEPAPEDILDLFEKLQKNKVLELHWKCPGRLPPESENRDEENPKDIEMEQEKEEETKPLQPTEFDFDDDTSEPTAKLTPRRTPGSAPKTPKRVARMDKVLQDIMTQRKLNAAEREARKAKSPRAGQSQSRGRVRSPGSSQQTHPANKSTPVRFPFRESNSKSVEEKILDFSISSAESSRVPGTNTQGVQTPGRIPSVGLYTKSSTINRGFTGLSASAPPGRTVNHTPMGMQMNRGLAGMGSSKSPGFASVNDNSIPDSDVQSKSGNGIAHAGVNLQRKSPGEGISSGDTYNVTDPSKVEDKSIMSCMSTSPGQHSKAAGIGHLAEMSETNWVPDSCPAEPSDDSKTPATVGLVSESVATVKTALPGSSTASNQSVAFLPGSTIGRTQARTSSSLTNTPSRIPNSSAMVATPSRMSYTSVSSGSIIGPGRVPFVSDSSANLGTPSRVPNTSFAPRHAMSTPGRVPTSGNPTMQPTPSRVPVVSNTPRHASVPRRVAVSDEMTFASQPNRFPVTSSISATAPLGTEDNPLTSYIAEPPFGTVTDQNSQSKTKANNSVVPLQVVSQNPANSSSYSKPESVDHTVEMGQTEAQEKMCTS